jgi:hypothetical protein
MRTTSTTIRWGRHGVLLAVIGLLLACAGTALAKPGPGKPEKPTHTVTMGLTGEADGEADGVATTCPGPITMTMVGRELGAYGKDLYLNVGVAWDRTKPEPLPPAVRTGCQADRAAGVSPVVLVITPGDDTVEILWRFDQYTWNEGKKFRVEVLELASVGAVSWTDGVVSGPFTFRRYTAGAWTSFGTHPLTFTLTIDPIGP